MASASPAGRRVSFILGMHRSGTSMLARAIATLGEGRPGIGFGGPLLTAPAEDNALGYWESAPVVAVQQRLCEALFGGIVSPAVVRGLPAGWLDGAAARTAAAELTAIVAERLAEGGGEFCFKDPRTALLLPLWRQVLDRVGATPRWLLMLRDPRAVAASLAVRNGTPLALGEALWLRHHAALLAETGRELAYVGDYDAFLAAPLRELGRLAAVLGLAEPDATQAADLVRQGLRHQAPASGPAMVGLAARLHAALTGPAPADDAAPPLAAFEALVATLDATPGWLEHALGFDGPAMLRLMLPFTVEGSGGTALLHPGSGVTVRLEGGNGYCGPREAGFLLHANPPGASPVRLAFRGLPDWPGGCRFEARIASYSEAPPMLFRAVLEDAAGAVLHAEVEALPPGGRPMLRWTFPPVRGGCFRLEVELAAEAASNSYGGVTLEGAALIPLG